MLPYYIALGEEGTTCADLELHFAVIDFLLSTVHSFLQKCACNTSAGTGTSCIYGMGKSQESQGSTTV